MAVQTLSTVASPDTLTAGAGGFQALSISGSPAIGATGPATGLSNAPAVTEDSSGNVYIAYSVSCGSGDWKIMFTEGSIVTSGSSVDQVAWSSPVQADGSTCATEDVSPTISVMSAGSNAGTICVTYMSFAAGTLAPAYGHYYVSCSVTGATWIVSSTPGDFPDCAYGGHVFDVAGSWDPESGRFVVGMVTELSHSGAAGCGSSTYYNVGYLWDTWTVSSGTPTYANSKAWICFWQASCWTAANQNAVFSPQVVMSCSGTTSATACVFLNEGGHYTYGTEFAMWVASNNGDDFGSNAAATCASCYSFVQTGGYTPSSFTSGSYVGGLEGISATCATPPCTYSSVPAPIVWTQVAFAPGSSTNVAATVLWDPATSGAVAYDVFYYPTTTPFALPTHFISNAGVPSGETPTTSTSGTGYQWCSLGLGGSTPAAFVDWTTTGNAVQVTAETNWNGDTWNGDYEQVASSIATSALAATPSLSQANAWRVDTLNVGSVSTYALTYDYLLAPYINGLSPSSGPVGTSTPVTATTTGGALISGGGFGSTFSWSASPTGSGCPTASGVTVTQTCTDTTGGTYGLTISFTDFYGFASTQATLTYTVGSYPSLTTPTVGGTGSGDNGQQLTISTTESGGLAPFTFTWSSNSYLSCTATTSSPSTTCTVQNVVTSASAIIYVYVEDSNSCYYPNSGTLCLGPPTQTQMTSAIPPTSLSFTVYSDPAVTALTPGPTSGHIDAYQTTTWIPTVSGGTGTVSTYTWTQSLTSFGCSGSGSPATKYVCTPTAASTYTVALIVVDSNGCYSGGSSTCGSPGTIVTSTSFVVYSDPVVSGYSANPLSTHIDVYQTTTWTPTVTGGSGTMSTYTWGQSSPSFGCAGVGSPATTYACTPTAVNTYSVNLLVVDSNGCYSGGTSTCSSPGASVTSSSFVVYADPAVTKIAANPLSGLIDSYQTTTWSIAFTGGSGISTYSWGESSGSFGCVGVGSPATTYACTPTAAGTYSVNIILVDSNGCYSGGTNTCNSPGKAATSSNFVVDPDPVVTALTPSPASGLLDVNQQTVWTPTITGGSGTISTYTWTQSSPNFGCVGVGSPASTYACTPTVAGTYYVTLVVVDSNGCYSGGSSSCTSPGTALRSSDLVVNIDPSITSFGASPDPIYTGHTTFLNVTASGGTGSFTYAFTGLPSGCASSSTASLTCSPVAWGSFTVRAYANDTTGYSSTATTVLTVNPAPLSISTFTALPDPILLDHTTYLNVTVSGGAGTMTYTYTGLPGGCASGSVTSLTCVPSHWGTYTVRVYVNDSASQTANSATGLTVNLLPVFISSFSASPATITVNHTTYLNVSATGGTGTLIYAYTGLPTGCSTKNVTSLTCTPSVWGVFSIRVFANDTAGQTTSSVTSLTVNSVPLSISSFSASPNPITVNSTTFLNVTASGGKSALTYTFTGLPAGCASSNAVSLLCLPRTIGAFNIRVYANDSFSNSDTRTVVLTVKPFPLAIGPITASPNPIVANHTTYVNVSASGGWGRMIFGFAGLPPGCLSSNVASLTCVPNAMGTYVIRAYVNDSAGQSANGTVTLTVKPMPLTLGSFGAHPSSILVNQTAFLNVTASGGAGSLAYSFTGLPSGCVPLNVKSLTCTPTALGTFTIRVFVNDSGSSSVTGTTMLTVNPVPLAINSFTAAPSPIIVGHTTYINVSSTGGWGTLAFAYTGVPPGCTASKNDTFACASTTVGNYTILVYVNDSVGQSVSSALFLAVVPAVPTIYLFAATPNPISVTQTTLINVTASGGTGTISFAYAGLPRGCVSSDTDSLTCTPTASGTFIIRVYANDTSAQSATATVTLVVDAFPLPVINSFRASLSPTIVGHLTFLNVSASGGTGTLAYAYAGLPAGCSSRNVASLTCTPNARGAFIIRVYVNDTESQSASATLALTVNPVPLVISSFGASPAAITVNQTTFINVTASGGTGPLAYAYTGLPTGCTSSNALSIACTPTSPGMFTIRVFANDSAGQSATSTVSLTVGRQIIALAITSFTVSPNQVTVGGKVTLTAAVSGGTVPYSFAYSGLPSGCSSKNASSFSCIPSVPGSYTITLKVSDSDGLTASRSVSLAVLGTSALSVTLASDSGNISAGQSVLLTAHVTGGVGPYVYAWSLNGTNVSYAPANTTWQETLVHGGVYTFRFWVKDSAGTIAGSASIVVGVTYNAQGSSSTPFPWWIVVAAVAAAFALLLFVFFRRRRARHPKVNVTEDLEASTVQASSTGEGSKTAEGLSLAAGTAAAAEPTAEADTEFTQSGPPLNEGGLAVPPGEPVIAPHEAAATTPVQDVRSETELPAPLSPAPEEPLTACPQCNGPLGPNLSCEACGVSWIKNEPDSRSAPPVEIPSSDVTSQEPSEAPPAPVEQAPGNLEEEALPRAVSAETPRVDEGTATLVEAVPEAPISGSVKAPEETTPEPLRPETERSSPGPKKIDTCFICGAKLKAGYCPDCDMHWEGDDPPEGAAPS